MLMMLKQPALPDEICDLHFEEPIQKWYEAIPLGNGLLGALLWGNSNAFRMSIDRGDLWDTTPYDGLQSPEFSYAEMVRLAGEKNAEGIQAVFDGPYNHATPTKLPAGKILLNIGEGLSVQSHLSLKTAEAVITFAGETERPAVLRSFLHGTESAGFLQITGTTAGIRVECPAFGHEKQEEAGTPSLNRSLDQLCYPLARYFEEEEFLGFVQEIPDGGVYGLLTLRRQIEDRTEIVYTVGYSQRDGKDWLPQAKEKLRKLLLKGYAASFAEHKVWWENFWGKSSLSLPDKFFEKNWYLTNYLLGSCSRKGYPPMPLQGVWTADNGELPPWKGDYHHDLNTQMCYYSYLKANHLEEGESFLDFLWDLKPCAEEFARRFYKTEGLCLPAVMTIHGEPLGGWGMYSLSPTNQLWLCQTFERHFAYTGDMVFLREKAYPYMKGAAEMILGLLEKNETNQYVLPVSSSPEIHDNTAEAWLTPNSNYDLSIMRYLFGALAKLSRRLDNGEESRWLAELALLPELAVDERGVLMLCPDETLQESHRHHAHAMAIHPLRLLDPDCQKDRRIIDATVLDLERLGTGWWVGYSFTWFAEIFAVQRNGEGAAHQLRTFWESFCSPNGFHLNGDYRRRGLSCFHYVPFTLEGNMCAADVLQEMLLKSENGVLEIFPAIPDDWKEASFTDFRGEEGVLVSASLKNGKLQELALKTTHAAVYRIRSPYGLDGLSGLPKADKDGTVLLSCEPETTYCFPYIC